MKTQICCKNPQKGRHDFFLVADNQEYFLFSQKYHTSVQRHFRKGLRVEEIFDFSKARSIDPVVHTLTKLPAYIKYVENEYGISVLKQTQKRRELAHRSGKLPA